MVDLQTIKDIYRNMELNNVSFIRSDIYIVYSLTNVWSHSVLIYALKSGLISHPIDQCVIQNHNETFRLFKDGKC